MATRVLKYDERMFQKAGEFIPKTTNVMQAVKFTEDFEIHRDGKVYRGNKGDYLVKDSEANLKIFSASAFAENYVLIKTFFKPMTNPQCPKCNTDLVFCGKTKFYCAICSKTFEVCGSSIKEK
jgi:hypothetical protein